MENHPFNQDSKGYQRKVAKNKPFSCSPQASISPPVVLSVSLLLRNRPTPSPSSLLLFNHHENHATISILYGSRHFQVSWGS